MRVRCAHGFLKRGRNNDYTKKKKKKNTKLKESGM